MSADVTIVNGFGYGDVGGVRVMRCDVLVGVMT
jgi:hypothetical protein